MEGMIVILFFLGYLILLLLVSFLAFRSTKTAEDHADEPAKRIDDEAHEEVMSQHFLGGRSLGCIVTVMTLAGTVYSGYTMIAVPAEFARNGYLGVRWFGVVTRGTIGSLFIVPRLRRLACVRQYISPLDFVNDRFRSRTLHGLATFSSVLPSMFYLAAQVVSLRESIEGSMGGIVNAHAATVGCCTIMVVYEWAGGMTSVAYTSLIRT